MSRERQMPLLLPLPHRPLCVPLSLIILGLLSILPAQCIYVFSWILRSVRYISLSYVCCSYPQTFYSIPHICDSFLPHGSL
jgi:hypothetical protein